MICVVIVNFYMMINMINVYMIMIHVGWGNTVDHKDKD